MALRMAAPGGRRLTLGTGREPSRTIGPCASAAAGASPAPTIAAVAKSNGFSIVMDRDVAAKSGLVIYADPTSELTDAVSKAVK